MAEYLNNIDFRESTCFHSQKGQNEKFGGFDFLRAIFAISIVAIHSNLFLTTKNLKIGSISTSDILSANLAYLAVPVFFNISLFLFYIKSEKMGHSYFFQKRLPKIFSLYLFWVISKIVFDIILKGKSEALQNSTSSIKAFIEFIVSGGNSPLYFFFSLAFITAISEFVVFLLRKIDNISLKNRFLYSSLLVSCVLVFMFSVLRLLDTSVEGTTGLIKSASNFAKWAYNPLNFLPYIFTTAIVFEEFHAGQFNEEFIFGINKLKIKLCVLLSMFLMFSVLEWSFTNDLLNYSRLSLVFGSWLLLYLALLSASKVPLIIQFISGCSLGIYTFHLFFTHSLFTIYPNILTPLLRSSPILAVLLEFFVALTSSILLTLLFRKFKLLKGFV